MIETFHFALRRRRWIERLRRVLVLRSEKTPSRRFHPRNVGAEMIAVSVGWPVVVNMPCESF